MSTEIVPNQNGINRQHALKIGKQAMKAELKALISKKAPEAEKLLNAHGTALHVRHELMTTFFCKEAEKLVQHDERYLALKAFVTLSVDEETLEDSGGIRTCAREQNVSRIICPILSPTSPEAFEKEFKAFRESWVVSVPVTIVGMDFSFRPRGYTEIHNMQDIYFDVPASEEIIKSVKDLDAKYDAYKKARREVDELRERLSSINEYMEELEATLLVEELKSTEGGDKVIEMTQNILGRSLGTSARLLPALDGTTEEKPE